MTSIDTYYEKLYEELSWLETKWFCPAVQSGMYRRFFLNSFLQFAPLIEAMLGQKRGLNSGLNTSAFSEQDILISVDIQYRRRSQKLHEDLPSTIFLCKCKFSDVVATVLSS